jgi:Zn-dependent membrane protease YugP
MYWILFIGIALLSYVVQSNLKRKMEKYSRMPVSMTGREVAEKMLRDNGIYDVRVISTPGRLTDHYNPTDKTVNLSEDVYNRNSIAAASVAAHECGHAVQHAQAYAPLNLRSKLVPAVSFASNWVQWILLIGIFTIETFPQVMLGGILLFAMTTLFSFITLPVEIDASRRATNWLSHAGIVSASSYPMAVDALRSAAYTYVIAALSSLATLIYYLSIFMNRRD